MIKQATNKAICSTGMHSWVRRASGRAGRGREGTPSRARAVGGSARSRQHAYAHGGHTVDQTLTLARGPVWLGARTAHGVMGGMTAALGELKSYTENPKTLARLRGDSKASGAARQKLLETTIESSLTAKHVM
jgi:hypothetical protein